MGVEITWRSLWGFRGGGKHWAAVRDRRKILRPNIHWVEKAEEKSFVHVSTYCHLVLITFALSLIARLTFRLANLPQQPQEGRPSWTNEIKISISNIWLCQISRFVTAESSEKLTLTRFEFIHFIFHVHISDTIKFVVFFSSSWTKNIILEQSEECSSFLSFFYRVPVGRTNDEIKTKNSNFLFSSLCSPFFSVSICGMHDTKDR